MHYEEMMENLKQGFPIIHRALLIFNENIESETQPKSSFLSGALKTLGTVGAIAGGATLINPEMASTALHSAGNFAAEHLGSGTVSNALTSAGDNVVSGVNNLKTNIDNVSSNAVKSFRNGINNGMNSVGSSIENGVKSIKDSIGGSPATAAVGSSPTPQQNESPEKSITNNPTKSITDKPINSNINNATLANSKPPLQQSHPTNHASIPTPQNQQQKTSLV